MREDTVILRQPSWLEDYEKFCGTLLGEDELARLLLELVRANTDRKTGGPFSAALTDREGTILSLAVNTVLSSGQSLAHAEINALALAQARLKTFDLSQAGYLKLYASAQPCLMCCGGLVWSGARELAYISSKDDVERILGFDEGFLPADWAEELQKRGIAVRRIDAFIDAGQRALEHYRDSSGMIYNSAANELLIKS
jgi:tRNA(Arg) A34 adenosine deaminase TadA